MTMPLLLVLSLACENQVVETDDTGGGGNADSEDSDTQTDDTGDTQDTSDSDSDSDSDSGSDTGSDSDDTDPPQPRFVQWPDSSGAAGEQVLTRDDGSLLVAGTFQGLDLSSGGLGTLGTDGDMDAFIGFSSTEGVPSAMATATDTTFPRFIEPAVVGDRVITGVTYSSGVTLQKGGSDEAVLSSGVAQSTTAVASYSGALGLEWVIQVDGQRSLERYQDAPRIATYADGTACIAASVVGPMNLVDSAGTSLPFGANAGFINRDVWIVRADAAGNVTWSRELDVPGDMRIYGAESLADGTCVLAGATNAQDYQVEAGDPATLITNTGSATRALFVLSIDSSGVATVPFQVDTGESEDELYGAIPDGDEWVLFGKAASSFSLPGGATINASFNNRTLFLTRIGDTGDAAWLSTITGSGGSFQWIRDHHLYDDGSMLVLVETDGAATWTHTGGSESYPAGTSAVLGLLDSTGSLVWSRHIVATNPNDGGVGLAGFELDAAGDVVVFGTLFAESTFAAGTPEGFARTPVNPNTYNPFFWTVTPPGP